MHTPAGDAARELLVATFFGLALAALAVSYAAWTLPH